MEERAPEPPTSTKGKVLVVDDEKSIVRLLQSIIERRGFEVVTASDGADGLEIALKGGFVLIILDLVLPGMEGLELLERLKQEDATRETPVALLTTQTQEMAESRPGVRADWFVRKPFGSEEIVRLLPTS